MREDRRKADTRKKITLGGLIVKAGLANANPAFLLGVLLEAAAMKPASPAYHHHLATGRAAFSVDGQPQQKDDANAEQS